jgi:hypothetical protein
MIIEEIIAKKSEKAFLHYEIIKKKGKSLNNNLELYVDTIGSSILQDLFDYENSSKMHDFGISDDWNALYGQKIMETSYYVQIYDFWANEKATKEDGIHLNLIESLKIKTKDNLMQLIDAWKFITKNKPNFIIVTLDDQDLITVETTNDKPKDY